MVAMGPGRAAVNRLLLILLLVAAFAVGLLVRPPIDRCLTDPVCAAKLSDPPATMTVSTPLAEESMP